MIEKYNLRRVISLQDTDSYRLLRNVKNSKGTSYLVGWAGMNRNAHLFTFHEVKQYIMLAGLRDYNEYLRTGINSLDMDFCPVPQSDLLQNRLLSTLKNRLFFQYEEEAIRV